MFTTDMLLLLSLLIKRFRMYKNNNQCTVTSTSIKNNCLMKSEVGMAVLKSKQTRIVGIISTYVQYIPTLAFLVRLCDTSTSIHRYS